MHKTEKKAAAKTRFELRLSAAEAVKLEAISNRLRIPKAEVLRLSLSSDPQQKSHVSDRQAAAIGEALEALISRAHAVEDRLKNLETLMESAVDLLLSISRTAQRSAEATPSAQNPLEPGKATGLSWSEFQKKNPKLNPVMSEADWLKFLRERYEKTFGLSPDLST
jgi:hypothetical protein